MLKKCLKNVKFSRFYKNYQYLKVSQEFTLKDIDMQSHKNANL